MNIYVLQVVTGKENNARKNLESIISDYDGRVFFPRRELIQRKAGRRYKKVQAVFPGYLFLELPELSDTFVHDVVHLHSVIQFLPDTRNILPVSREDGDRLKPFLRGGGLTALVNVIFNEDDRIVVKGGPLKGLEGLIVKVDRRRKRIRVKLNLYENCHLVDFGYRDLNKRS